MNTFFKAHIYIYILVYAQSARHVLLYVRRAIALRHRLILTRWQRHALPLAVRALDPRNLRGVARVAACKQVLL